MWLIGHAPRPAETLVFKPALHRATRSGKQMIEAIDVVAAVLDETQGRRFPKTWCAAT